MQWLAAEDLFYELSDFLVIKQTLQTLRLLIIYFLNSLDAIKGC